MRDVLKNKEKVNEYEPPQKVKLFCYALVSEGVKGNKDAAERVSGVKKGKFYWLWRTEPRFRAWYHDLCLQILGTNAAIPPVALLGNIVRGDTQAIRTYYELMGKINNREVEQKNSTQIIIIRSDENKAQTLARQVHIQQEPVSGPLEFVGNRQDNVADLAGNAIQRANPE